MSIVQLSIFATHLRFLRYTYGQFTLQVEFNFAFGLYDSLSFFLEIGAHVNVS